MTTVQNPGGSLFIFLNPEEVREKVQKEGAGEGSRLQSDLEVHPIYEVLSECHPSGLGPLLTPCTLLFRSHPDHFMTDAGLLGGRLLFSMKSFIH